LLSEGFLLFGKNIIILAVMAALNLKENQKKLTFRNKIKGEAIALYSLQYDMYYLLLFCKEKI
jgi:hypothetical protein